VGAEIDRQAGILRFCNDLSSIARAASQANLPRNQPGNVPSFAREADREPAKLLNGDPTDQLHGCAEE